MPPNSPHYGIFNVHTFQLAYKLLPWFLIVSEGLRHRISYVLLLFHRSKNTVLFFLHRNQLSNSRMWCHSLSFLKKTNFHDFRASSLYFLYSDSNSHGTQTGGISLAHHSCILSHLSRVWLFVTPWTMACQASLSMGFSRRECWRCCHSLVQGIFPTQGLNLDFLRCRQILYHLSHQESPSSYFICILRLAFYMPISCSQTYLFLRW